MMPSLASDFSFISALIAFVLAILNVTVLHSLLTVFLLNRTPVRKSNGTCKNTPPTFSPQKSNNSTFPIILNKSYGGFTVSVEGYKLYAQKRGLKLYYYRYVDEEGDTFIYKRYLAEELKKEDLHPIFYFSSIKDLGEYTNERPTDPTIILDLDKGHREDPILVEVVRELGQSANTFLSDLKIVDVPISFANGNYTIDDYDGIETLHEKIKHIY